MRHRIALCGFSAFEYRAMHFSFQHPTSDALGYEVVDALVDADFFVVDADSKPAVKGVLMSGRSADAVFVGGTAPADAAALLPRPIDPTRILRALDELARRYATRPAAASEPPSANAAPALEDETDDGADAESDGLFTEPLQPFVWLDDDVAADGGGAPAADAPTAFGEHTTIPPSALPPPHVQSHGTKAATRAAVRRARLAHQRTAAAQGGQPLDVLVLDAEPEASLPLCDLLARFGFNVHAVTKIAHARNAIAAHVFSAFFLQIALDGADEGEGVALLQTIQSLPRQPGCGDPAVVLVAARPDPADRVRAALAGVGAPIVKPVSRGDVARALESRGVPLPADARRT